MRAGANAVLRRPLERVILEATLAKLLAVPRRVVARVPVSGQVVGTSRAAGGGHFCGLTHNLSVNGMLLASPLRLSDEPNLDLEFVLPGVRARLRALGRVVREAPEVAWPFRGYGVEFLFVPEDSHATISLVVSGALRPALLGLDLPDQKHGIHSTVCREEWVYEIREPVQGEQGWEAEIRRAPRDNWRPGIAGPFFVVAGGLSRSGPARGARVRRPARREAFPRVSVLLPVRDAAATLPECLASLAAQTLEDHEVLAVDDHSTDGSRAILEGARPCRSSGAPARQPGPRAGGGPQRRRGGGARPLLARMDADDVSHRSAWPRRWRGSTAIRISTCWARACGSSGARPRNEGMRAYVDWLNALLDHDAIARDMYVESPLAHPSVMMRAASLLARLGGYREFDGPEDYDLWLRAHAAGAALRQAARGAARLARRARAALAHRPALRRRCASATSRSDALERGPLARRPRAVLWGAGPVGKGWSQARWPRAATRWPPSSRSHPRPPGPAHPRRAGGDGRRGRRPRRRAPSGRRRPARRPRARSAARRSPRSPGRARPHRGRLEIFLSIAPMTSLILANPAGGAAASPPPPPPRMEKLDAHPRLRGPARPRRRRELRRPHRRRPRRAPPRRPGRRPHRRSGRRARARPSPARTPRPRSAR